MSLPYRPECFLLKLAILLVHLTNIVQAPLSLGLSILYGLPGINLRDNTQATDAPLAHSVLGVFSWLPWVLLPGESWCWVVPRHSTDVIVLQRSTSDVFNAVRGKYRKGTYSVTIVTSVPWDMEWVLRSWPCYELQSSVASSNKSEMRQRSCIGHRLARRHWAIG